MVEIMKIYDLEKRTLQLSKNYIKIIKGIKPKHYFKPIISQSIRSITSIRANYSEANGAISKKDFRHKIYICKKESKESMYWLEILMEEYSSKYSDFKIIHQEILELIFIFSKILKTINNKNK